jgi:hypothetical protein
LIGARAQGKDYIVVDLFAIWKVKFLQIFEHADALSEALIAQALSIPYTKVYHRLLWALAYFDQGAIRYEIILWINGLGLDFENLEKSALISLNKGAVLISRKDVLCHACLQKNVLIEELHLISEISLYNIAEDLNVC